VGIRDPFHPKEIGYAADRAGTGLHILELTGAARTIANIREPGAFGGPLSSALAIAHRDGRR
jgi:hypothetical protein